MLFSILGGCVDYQFRMVTSGTTGLMFVLALWGGLKWRTPLLMIFPYMAGRAVTALVQSAEMEVVAATPLLAVGYFWGHVTYSADPTMDVARMLLFCGVCWMAARAAMNSCGVSEDLAMAGAANISPVVALVLSWVSLYRNKSWLWFIGLLWGIAGPLLISAAGINIFRPFCGAAQCSMMNGPVLFYSDQLITLPMCFAGQILEAIRGKPRVPTPLVALKKV
jgi:hypothetical protein